MSSTVFDLKSLVFICACFSISQETVIFSNLETRNRNFAEVEKESTKKIWLNKTIFIPISKVAKSLNKILVSLG